MNCRQVLDKIEVFLDLTAYLKRHNQNFWKGQIDPDFVILDPTQCECATEIKGTLKTSLLF